MRTVKQSSYTRFLRCKTLLFALKKNSDLKKISFYIFQADTLFILRGTIYFILIVINFKFERILNQENSFQQTFFLNFIDRKKQLKFSTIQFLYSTIFHSIQQHRNKTLSVRTIPITTSNHNCLVNCNETMT